MRRRRKAGNLPPSRFAANRYVRRALLVAVAVSTALTLTGCLRPGGGGQGGQADSSNATVPSQPAEQVVADVWTPADTIPAKAPVGPVKVTRETTASPCIVKKVFASDGHNYITVDFIQFFQGKRAVTEAKKRGVRVGDPKRGYVYYVVNQNPKTRTFEVPVGMKVRLFRIAQGIPGVDTSTWRTSGWSVPFRDYARCVSGVKAASPGTATTSGQAATGPASTAARNRQPFWGVIVASLSKSAASKQQADELAGRLCARGFDGFVVNTNEWSSLTPGLYAVVAAGAPGKDACLSQLNKVKAAGYSGAYAKKFEPAAGSSGSTSSGGTNAVKKQYLRIAVQNGVVRSLKEIYVP